MATTSYGTPYVVSADLVSGYPSTSLSLADRVDDISFKGNGINDQTGTTYTLDILDAGKTVTLNNGSAVTVTIPTNTAEAIEIGSLIRFYNKGAGTVTIQPTGGVTLEGGNLILGQYGSATIVKIDTNTWAPYQVNPAWISYTPTLTQSAGVAIKNNASKYCIIGDVVHVFVYALGNGTGTAGNEMTLSLPVNCAGSGTRLGSVQIYDSSAIVSYSGMAFARSASTFAVVGDWSGSSFWGVTPSLAIGTDDQFTAVLTYERG